MIDSEFFVGAINDDNGKANNVKNQLTGQYDEVPQVARQYKKAGKPWVVIGNICF